MKIKAITLEDVGNIVNGKVLGEKTVKIDDISALHNATNTSLSLFTGVFAYLEKLQNTKALACFVKDVDIKKLPESVIAIEVQDPYLAMAQTVHQLIGCGEVHNLEFLTKEEKPSGVSPMAVVSKCAKIGKNVIIMPNAYIGVNVEIQDDVVIHACASLEHCRIGQNSIVRSGARIGTMGFGFVPNFQNGEHFLVPQISRAILGKSVDVGANTCIDRGFLTDTIIDDYTKIDNLCHIAHGVEIGKSCFLAGCVGIAGGAKIGNFCMFGGNSVVAGNVVIADFTQVVGMSGITSDVLKSKQILAGMPAVSSTKWKRMHFNALKRVEKS